MNDSDDLVSIKYAEGVGYVTMCRERKRNAIDVAMAEQFIQGADELFSRGARVFVLSARGSAFCAGADMGEAANSLSPFPVDKVIQSVQNPLALWIAQVEGAAVGAGVALALRCQLTFMTEDSWLWLPELSRLGRFPRGVVNWLAPSIGFRQSFNLAMSERKVAAEEAARHGWISGIHGKDTIGEAVKSLAIKLAAGPPEVISGAADAFADAMGLSGKGPSV